MLLVSFQTIRGWRLWTEEEVEGVSLFFLSILEKLKVICHRQ